MASDGEIAAMRQAIIVSALGLGTTSPNPPVGCVILDRHGRVAGAGYHRRKGEAHAEVNALAAAGAAARGGTAVVTLEPCNHVGVTPACRQALIDAGVVRVVIGVMDPTSRGEGGAAVMASLGVEVETGVLAAEVLSVLGPWLTATTRGTPTVTAAFAVDIDHEGLTEPSLLLALRSGADVVLDGERIEEGVIGGHSPHHLRLSGLQRPEKMHDEWLADAYQRGVRTLLFLGSSQDSAAILAMQAVDQIVVAVPRISESSLKGSFASHVSRDFEIVDVSGWPHGLLVRFTKSHEDS
ncbi:bifunctional diaminohydroxyphosphoribosylaminopyrimidine deaminase/5-amino-6-(5-phosphoribosylamino)uracil reductase RibD [Actinoplanes sp. CA-054009]